MLRALGFLINPVGAIVWPILQWMGRGFDRLLGPVVGWWFALLLALLMAASLALGVYQLADRAGRLAGVLPPLAAVTTTGTVTDVVDEERKTLTIRQRITVSFVVDGQRDSISETVTEPITDEHKIGDSVVVYLPEGGAATTRDPNDPFLDVVLLAFGLVVPLVLLVLSLRYVRYRRRLLDRRPAPAAVARPPQGPVLAGNQRVLSTAERIKADEERFRKK